jgi:hypothetical protein
VNPFDLHGPQFLAFYICFAFALLSVLYLSRTLGGSREIAKPPMDDPYFVACLRGGEKECVRVATLALIDRGLLAVKSPGTSVLTGAAMGENRLEVTDPQAISTVKRPIDHGLSGFGRASLFLDGSRRFGNGFDAIASNRGPPPAAAGLAESPLRGLRRLFFVDVNDCGFVVYQMVQLRRRAVREITTRFKRRGKFVAGESSVVISLGLERVRRAQPFRKIDGG